MMLFTDTHEKQSLGNWGKAKLSFKRQKPQSYPVSGWVPILNHLERESATNQILYIQYTVYSMGTIIYDVTTKLTCDYINLTDLICFYCSTSDTGQNTQHKQVMHFNLFICSWCEYVKHETTSLRASFSHCRRMCLSPHVLFLFFFPSLQIEITQEAQSMGFSTSFSSPKYTRKLI